MKQGLLEGGLGERRRQASMGVFNRGERRLRTADPVICGTFESSRRGVTLTGIQRWSCWDPGTHATLVGLLRPSRRPIACIWRDTSSYANSITQYKKPVGRKL